MRKGLYFSAGELNRQISIRSNTRSANGSGGYTITPTDAPPIWARVEPLEGREQLVAMQAGIERPHRFQFQYEDAPAVSAISQIVYDTRVFDVRSVIDVEELHIRLVVLADEIITEE